jgi:hypothetical protein
MYNLLVIPSFAADLSTARREAALAGLRIAAAALPGLVAMLAAPTLPGVYNGGDAICRLSFADKAACDAALASLAWAPAAALLADRAIVTSADTVGFESGASGGASDGARLYRVALFCANVRPDPERLAAFAADTLTMPDHVRSIRRWQLSTADRSEGTRPWTHVWEQEYPDLDGLNGPYMMHPVHWAHVERWFDTEYPEHLVDPVLVHTFCAIDRTAIAG